MLLLNILKCFLTQVTDEGVEALIGQETKSLVTQNLPAHYTIAQANMVKMRDKIKREKRGVGTR